MNQKDGNGNNLMKSVYKNPVSEIAGKLSEHCKSETVFGEPMELADGKKVIPVSKVTYSFGGGGGADNKFEGARESHGGGGGGFASVKPLGMYEVSERNTKFIPVVDITVLLLSFTIFPLILALFLKLKK
ncbi:GerW family sporulation protein [Evansella clarkii]|uniref:GerW family sporulation protein n=1 Tax=Evansella clarkii TaxID=79879 RepID=UPI0009971CC6|nr:spore germination protein GerW family protein [Evansella clarkii]